MSDAINGQPLPKGVKEHDTAFTNVYEHGKLVYDGNEAREGRDPRAGLPASSAGPAPGSLNEMLKWGVANSDPEELARRAAAGERAAPTQIDREIMDMLIGEPIVAKMRACLAKVPGSAELPADGEADVETALGALEELEYYVEDIDNATDMAKIGGVQQLLTCCAAAACDAEVREAACSVLGTALQNNPKVQEAAVAHELQPQLLALLSDGADDDGTLPLRRKALFALSALLRSSDDATAELLASGAGVGTLLACGAHADAKLRRRALFLLLNLARAEPHGPALVHSLGEAPSIGTSLLEGATDADEDTREQALSLLLLLAAAPAAPALRASLRSLDAARRLGAVLRSPAVAEGEGNPEHAGHIGKLLQWLG